MIQVNLIPDVKADFIKAQLAKRLVLTIASITSVVAIGLVIGLFSYVNIVQKQHTDNLAEDITRLATEYSGSGDIDKIITVQRQLQSIPGLASDRPQVARIVDYLSIVTPQGINYRTVDFSFDDSTLSIEGTGESVLEVNQFVDTLKNAEYLLAGETADDAIIAFENVVLANIGAGAENTRFSITLDFDKNIFELNEGIQLRVPQINTTLSEVERPQTAPQENLFETEDPGDENGQ